MLAITIVGSGGGGVVVGASVVGASVLVISTIVGIFGIDAQGFTGEIGGASQTIPAPFMSKLTSNIEFRYFQQYKTEFMNYE